MSLETAEQELICEFCGLEIEDPDQSYAALPDGGASHDARGRLHRPLKPEKDSEFVCPRYHSRCTESPIDGTEYGHKGGCPRREIDCTVNGGPSYDPEDDPYAQSDQQAITDGGDRRVD